MQPVIAVLLQGVLGAWIVAGFADWLCHRRTHIERTSGVAESVCHWILLVQMGLAIALCIAFRPTALLLCMLSGIWLCHQGTTYLELRWVAPIRPITPAEQMTHSFLEVLPVAGMLLIGTAVVDQALQQGTFAWTLQRRHPDHIAWRSGAWLPLALACVAFSGLPYLEELWRCLRWRARNTR